MIASVEVPQTTPARRNTRVRPSSLIETSSTADVLPEIQARLSPVAVSMTISDAPCLPGVQGDSP
ncbi:hypothetical protein [Microbispora sp. GKU 823]|uniref:hypothetical protein n=1 Tax=Microbispora sp. GKU 823 TaxID=1652100 RepID=UPI0009A2A747|nr:hypothetical protein [Microbispora sp. GKU 823]OPG02412.1 hypothetical protein B1L11_42535 [Microbispora sp. GKU 823]